MQRFKAKLTPVPGGGHYVVVPAEVSEAAGLRYGVRVTRARRIAATIAILEAPVKSATSTSTKRYSAKRQSR